MLNDTHDPSLKSWVESANEPSTDFPIQNLPLGMFLFPGDDYPRSGIGIGDEILDIAVAVDDGFFKGVESDHLLQKSLNGYAAFGRRTENFRRHASELLSEKSDPHPELLVPMSEVT